MKNGNSGHESNSGSMDQNSFGVVDLGALEFVGIVDVHGFPGAVEVDGAKAFTVAVASLLDSSKR